ncbi:MAG: hypothetical protein IJJ45_12480 [Clostridia bacterium]|nr:hypothetical protein [Clostridia bacterium]MBQ6375288.1 hypothetical protein [Clostridia bacterium]
MTPKEALSVAYAQERLHAVMAEKTGTTEALTILKEAYEEAMVCLGFSVYFNEDE